MSHPHVVQADRDWLDDHNVVDHQPAGDDPDKQNDPRAPGVTSTGGGRPNHPYR